jgi:FtsH-binding integral membrane protein
MAGIAGLVVGLTVFTPPRDAGRRILRNVYSTLLLVLVTSLVALIIRDWPGLETGSRIAFSGLAIMGVVMLVRIYLAHRLTGSDEPQWERRYVSHVYFTYVSLWVGFAIIPAVRSGNPGLWIPMAVMGVLTAGTLLVHRYERRLGLRPAS